MRGGGGAPWRAATAKSEGRRWLRAGGVFNEEEKGTESCDGGCSERVRLAAGEGGCGSGGLRAQERISGGTESGGSVGRRSAGRWLLNVRSIEEMCIYKVNLRKRLFRQKNR